MFQRYADQAARDADGEGCVTQDVANEIVGDDGRPTPSTEQVHHFSPTLQVSKLCRNARQKGETIAPRKCFQATHQDLRCAIDSGINVRILVEYVNEIFQQAGDALEDAQQKGSAPLAAFVPVSLVSRVLH